MWDIVLHDSKEQNPSSLSPLLFELYLFSIVTYSNITRSGWKATKRCSRRQYFLLLLLEEMWSNEFTDSPGLRLIWFHFMSSPWLIGWFPSGLSFVVDCKQHFYCAPSCPALPLHPPPPGSPRRTRIRSRGQSFHTLPVFYSTLDYRGSILLKLYRTRFRCESARLGSNFCTKGSHKLSVI